MNSKFKIFNSKLLSERFRLQDASVTRLACSMAYSPATYFGVNVIKGVNMINRILKILGSLFFGAAYVILGALALVAAIGMAAFVFLQSAVGVVVFALSLVLLIAVLFAIAHKPTRIRISNSKNGELAMLLLGVVGGTAVGMAISTLLILFGYPQFAIPIFLLSSVIMWILSENG